MASHDDILWALRRMHGASPRRLVGQLTVEEPGIVEATFVTACLLLSCGLLTWTCCSVLLAGNLIRVGPRDWSDVVLEGVFIVLVLAAVAGAGAIAWLWIEAFWN